MIVAIDVYYFQNKAKSVSIEFENWTDIEPNKIHISKIDCVEEYIPGLFYKRELPCIMEVLKNTKLEDIDCIIVDGYVHLDDYMKPGLGAYLYKELKEKIPVIGVAKKKFHENKILVKEVLRGESQNPLFISSIGIDLNEAKENIENMDGAFRIPTLLKILDQKTKE